MLKILLAFLVMAGAVKADLDSNGNMSTLSDSDYFPLISGENQNVNWGVVKGLISGGAAAGWTDSSPYIYTTTLSDNVGVGTRTPGSSLTVLKNSTKDMIHVNSTGGAGGNVFAIKNGGNVGIGSTQPISALDTGSGVISSLSIDADHVYNVKKYGAKGDGIHFADGAITSGTAAFTSSLATFTAADVGKVMIVVGAGAAGIDLRTTISAFTSANAVTLAANAGTTVSAVDFTYGTDDTSAIQSAINALGSNGGGTIFSPQGIYIIDGPFVNATQENSQLTFPEVDVANATQQITIKGENFQMMQYGAAMGDVGSVWYFSRDGTSAQSGIAAWGPGTVISVHFSNICVQLDHMTFRSVTNNHGPLVNLSLANQANGSYVNFEPGYNLGGTLLYSAITQPTNSGGIALITPQTFNHAWSYFDHLEIINFYNGIRLGEHGDLDKSGIYFTINAIVLEGAPHTRHIGFINLEDNVNNITFTSTGESGSSTGSVKIDNLDIEHAASGWYQTTYDINDASNYGIGEVHWFSWNANALLKNGGANLSYLHFGYPNTVGKEIIKGALSTYPTQWTDGTNTAGVYTGLLNGVNAIFMGSASTMPAYFGYNGAANVIKVEATNIGVGTYLPSSIVELGKQKLNVTTGGNVGIGSILPGASLDVQGNIRLNGTGAGLFRIQTGANTACTTTCTTGRALMGFDTGTVGVTLPHIVGPADATADECLCGS